MSLNDPQWGKRGGGNEGPPDLDEMWRNFNQKLGSIFGRRRGGGSEPGGPPSVRQLGGGAGLIVLVVLVEIGASAIPQVLAWNKIDRNGARPGVDRDEYAKTRRVRLSAKTGDGVDGLRQALIEAAASRTSPANPPNSTYSQIPGQEAAS